MRHLAALAVAGVFAGAALLASALADREKSGNGEENTKEEGLYLLSHEKYTEYSSGSVSRAGETRYQYDAHGRCTALVSDGEKTVFSYVNNTVTKMSGADVSVYSYDDAGNLLGVKAYTEGKLKSDSQSSYDSFGRKLCSQTSLFAEDGTETLSSKTEYTYDAEGLLLKEVRYGENGDITRVTRYSYDSGGKLLGLSITDAGGKLLGVNNYAYDAEGRLILEQQRDAAGYLAKNTVYEYTPEGRLFEKRFSDPDGREIFREQHFYGAAGNEIKQELFTRGELTRSCEYEYISI